MNEQLRKIAIEAKVEHCISHVRLQEFADLILKECIAQADKEEDRFLEMGEVDLALSMQNFQLLIKNHFGIKPETPKLGSGVNYRPTYPDQE